MHLNCKLIATLVLMIFLFSICIVYTYPMWTGNVIYPGGEVVPSHRAKVPTYYYAANNWLNKNSNDFRIFTLPLEIRAQDWGQYRVFWLFHKRPVIVHVGRNDVINYVSNLIEQNRTQYIGKILALMNVKFILHLRDVNQRYSSWVKSTEYYQSTLDSQKGLSVEKSFGKLDFYRNDYWEPMHIYVSSNAILIDGSLNEMFRVVASDNFTVGNSVLFLSNYLNQDQMQFIKEQTRALSTNLPEISVQKINPTKYQVKIENAIQPFFLVFSESYHPQWKAYLDRDFDSEQIAYHNINIEDRKQETKFMPSDISYLLAKPLPEENHFIVNGYANAWYIDPQKLDRDGTFSITLYFWGQSLFYIGVIISATTFFGCISYLIYDWRRKRR